MLFAIGDLHLGGAVNKPMDIFDAKWKNHAEKIAANWKSTVRDDDSVIINGDLSWAINRDELLPDIEFLRGLPGKKIISLGNHDYWFDSAAKFNALFPEASLLARGNFIRYEDYHICGTKGWTFPQAPDFKPSDLRLYNRELLRLKNSLDGATRDGASKILCVLHFPPFMDYEKGSGFLRLIESYPVTDVIYGHLHGASCNGAPQGEYGGIIYRLTSADYLDFTPHRVMLR